MIQTFVNVIVLGLMAHMIGDYVIQNDWMALEKSKHWWPVIVHGVTYTLPFIPLVYWFDVDIKWLALLIIGGTHLIIDHYKLPRHVVWARNQLAPAAYRPGHTATGFSETRPDWIAVWLLIIVDNLIHVGINTLALVYL